MRILPRICLLWSIRSLTRRFPAVFLSTAGQGVWVLVGNRFSSLVTTCCSRYVTQCTCCSDLDTPRRKIERIFPCLLWQSDTSVDRWFFDARFLFRPQLDRWTFIRSLQMWNRLPLILCQPRHGRHNALDRWPFDSSGVSYQNSFLETIVRLFLSQVILFYLVLLCFIWSYFRNWDFSLFPLWHQYQPIFSQISSRYVTFGLGSSSLLVFWVL